MHLLSSLNAGFAAAPLGHAEIYVRGTSTRATWYADLEGNGANSSGANITLDAQGSALVYVNQLVDVVIRDVDNTILKSFGDGVAAPNVEVRSLGFTGIDYDTAASAAGNPTNLKLMADLWLTNNGAIDWKVLVGGVATTIQAALAVVSGLFFNVKAYGAVGDGTTSDQAAFVAAHAAAVAAGGGVVFVPEGTYRLTGVLTWAEGVHLLGVGMSQSIITMDAASSSVLLFSTDFTGVSPVRIAGVAFTTSQANSTVTISCTHLTKLHVLDCRFSSTTSHTGRHITYADGGELTVERSVFTARGNAPCISNDHGTDLTFFRLRDNLFDVTVAGFATHAVKLSGVGIITGNKFDGSGASSNPTAFLELGASSNDKHFVTSNLFTTANATVAMAFTGAVQAVTRDNMLSGAVSRYTKSTLLTSGSNLEMPDIITGVGGGIGGAILHTSVATSAITIEMPTIFHVGQSCDLVVFNSSGSTWGSSSGFTLSGGSVKTAASLLALGAGTYGSVRFVAFSATLWVQEGAAVDDM